MRYTSLHVSLSASIWTLRLRIAYFCDDYDPHELAAWDEDHATKAGDIFKIMASKLYHNQ